MKVINLVLLRVDSCSLKSQTDSVWLWMAKRKRWSDLHPSLLREMDTIVALNQVWVDPTESSGVNGANYNNCYGASKYCGEIILCSLLIAVRGNLLKCRVQKIMMEISLYRLTLKSWLLTTDLRWTLKFLWVKRIVAEANSYSWLMWNQHVFSPGKPVEWLFLTAMMAGPHVRDCLMEVGMCSTNADLCQTVAQSRAASIQLIWVQINVTQTFS